MEKSSFRAALRVDDTLREIKSRITLDSHRLLLLPFRFDRPRRDGNALRISQDGSNVDVDFR